MLLPLLAACHAAAPSPRAVLVDLPFESGTWAATPETGAALDRLAAALRERHLAGEDFLIRVATPAGGDPGVARTLSRLRAAAIVDGLVARGVKRDRLSYDGLGADQEGERVEVIAR
jgi:outer membrane protein OmpA-like peptidoglycan-associated protein